MPHIFSPVQTVFYFFAIGIVIRQGKFHRTDNRLNPLPFFLPIGNCNRTDTVHAPDKRIKEYIIRDTAVFDNREVYPKKVTFPPSRLRDLSGTLRIRGQFATQIITGSRRIADDMSRHNIGFRVVNALVEDAGVPFTEERYGAIARMRIKNCELIILKPNTFMNLSGNAVRYWLQKENIPVENLLVVVDDLALPFGTLRLKPKGSDAGHNGLKNIQQLLGTQEYSRLRFGIGSDFPRGGQINYVLGKFPPEELQEMPEKIKRAVEIIKSFCLAGVQNTMNQYNNK